MSWLHPLAWFTGRILLINALRLLINSLSGNTCAALSSNPSGKLRLACTFNRRHGFETLLVASLLLECVRYFHGRFVIDAGVFGVGVVAAIGLAARNFHFSHCDSAWTAYSDTP